MITGGYRRFHLWAADYPKADRQFTMGVQRLTRLHVRGIEQVVDANSDELFNWPWIYMEHGNGWNLTEDEAARLREYLLRGGFLLSDDTHGDYEWESLARGLEMILPGRPIEDLKNGDEIFHVMYDLDEKFQIHGTRFIWGGRPYASGHGCAQVERDPRRQRPDHGGHLPQFRRGRRLGVGG